MARVRKTEPTLEELIPVFGQNRIAENKYKKLAKDAGDKVKKLMAPLLAQKIAEAAESEKDKITKVDITEGGYKVIYSVTKSVTFKDEVLEYLHKHKEFAPCIQVVETVDTEVLENLIYSGKLSKKLILGLDKYRETKETPKLNVVEVE